MWPEASRTVAAVWLCFLARGLFYAAALPLWEGYDEYSHFAYVQHVRVRGSIPIPGKTRLSREVSASLAATPLPWTIRNLVPGAMPYDSFWSLPRDLGNARIEAINKPPDAAAREEDPKAEAIYESQQPPLYYWLMAPFLEMAKNWSLAARVFLLRAVSILLSSLALPLGFLIARRVFGCNEPAICAIAIVTLMPEGMINIARVGNESLALLVCTLLVYLCVRMVQECPGPANSVGIGAALGCGLLTKVYFLTAIPAAAFAFAVANRRAGTTWRRRAALPVVGFSIAALAAFWWYRFIYAATGDITGQIQSVSVRGVPWAERLRVALRMGWLGAIDTAAFSHIWFGGWSFLQIRSWMYHVFYAVGLAALGGLIALLFRTDSPVPLPGRRPLLVLGVFGVSFCGSLAYQALVARLGGNLPMTNGWYLYCLVFAEVILVCAGLMALLPSRRQLWAPVGLAGLFAAMDLYGMNFVLLPYYLGWTAHSAGGHLPAFHVGQIWQTGLGEISWRVMLNRPFLQTSAAFAVWWAVYVTATMACVAIAIQAARTSRVRRVKS